MMPEDIKNIKNLWACVIRHAILDAKLKIRDAERTQKEKEIKKGMDYFLSKDFKLLCLLADLNVEPQQIEALLNKMIRKNTIKHEIT